jgi:hypothetical protein
MTVIKFFGMLVSVAGGRVGSIVPLSFELVEERICYRGRSG